MITVRSFILSFLLIYSVKFILRRYSRLNIFHNGSFGRLRYLLDRNIGSFNIPDPVVDSTNIVLEPVSETSSSDNSDETTSSDNSELDIISDDDS